MEDMQIIGMYQARDESAIKETMSNMAACFMALHLMCCQTMRIAEIVNDTYDKAWNTIPPNT